LKNPTLPAGWPTVGHIEIRNFGLRYREDLELAISDISVNIEGGEKVGETISKSVHALTLSVNNVHLGIFSPTKSIMFVCLGGNCG